MKKMFLVLMLAVFGFGTFQLNAQVNPEYKKELQSYLQNSGSVGAFDQAIEQMMAMAGGQLTDGQKAEIKTRSMDALVDLMVPLYEGEISLGDMKEFNKFYDTPAGQRIAAAVPKITMASMQIGQQWSTQLMQIIQDVMVK